MNEGKLYNMKLFLIFGLILLSIGLVYALTVTPEIPIGGTWDIDGNVSFNFTCIGNADQYLAALNETWSTNNDGTYKTNITIPIHGTSAAKNNTIMEIYSTGIIADGVWNWMVTCYNNTINTPVVNETVDIIGLSLAYFDYATLSGENYTEVIISNTTGDLAEISSNDYVLVYNGIYMATDAWNGLTVNVSYTYNQTESASSTPWVIKIDKTVPVAALISPAANYWPNSTIQIQAQCNDTNPNQMYLDIDGILNQTRNYADTVEEAWWYDVPGDGNYTFNVRCDDDASNYGSAEANITVEVDTTAPVVTINSPVNGAYLIDTDSLLVNYTVTETNNSCELWGLFNSTAQEINYSNGNTYFNQSLDNTTAGLTNSNLFVTVNITSESTPGTAYYFAVRCSDVMGTWAYSSNNLIYFDLDDPVAVNVTTPYNVTTGSDYLPNLTWVPIMDYYFEKYTIYFDNDTDFSSPLTLDITSNDTSSIEFASTLEADTQYYWKINTTTLSGRGGVSNETDGRYYKTDSICHTLEVGYNFCGIVRDANVLDGSYTAEGISLNQIQLETDADYIYTYNASHDWITYQSGATIDKYYNLSTGNTVVIYTDTETTWPIAGGVYNGRIWSTNQSVESPSWDLNMTNFTDGYNLYSIRQQEGRTLLNISRSFDVQGWPINGSVKYETYVNNSGIGETCYGARNCGQFVPFRYNWTINNDTLMRYGESVWFYYELGTYEGETVYWNLSCSYAGEC